MRRIPVLTLLVLLVAAAGASAYRDPANSSSPIPDPGVLFANGVFNVLYTGGWSANQSATATEAKGPYTPGTTPLLTGQPAWSATSDHSDWAPSVAKVGGQYVVFYAAIIRGDAGKGNPKRRCIGTGTAPNPTGPFTPRPRPIACIAGHGAPDPEPGVGPHNSTIDATPAYVTVNGQRRLYLTYKTQHVGKIDGHYSSTIRMVRLNIASGASTVLGKSHQLTSRPRNIEENPVLVQRGKVFTLFTSLGGYTTCLYHTEWRQSRSIWRWPQTSHRLAFPANTNTCATGNAQVVPGRPKNSWRIFFNGWLPQARASYPDDQKAKAQYYLYIGNVAWPGGRPRVTAIIPPA